MYMHGFDMAKMLDPDSEPGRGPCGIWAGKPSLPGPSPYVAQTGLGLGLPAQILYGRRPGSI